MKCILHNKELNYLCRSPGDIRTVKSWWLWCGGHSSWMGRQWVSARFCLGNLLESGTLEDQEWMTYIPNLKYGWNWLEIAPNGRLLWERQWNFSSVVVQRSDFTSQEGMCPIQLPTFQRCFCWELKAGCSGRGSLFDRDAWAQGRHNTALRPTPSTQEQVLNISVRLKRRDSLFMKLWTCPGEEDKDSVLWSGDLISCRPPRPVERVFS
jgi:hypothetical protein